MKIMFIHEAPGQFGVLHKYLNSQGLAESWLLCASSVYEREKNNIPNLVPFIIPQEENRSYFYIKKLEARIKRSFYIRKAVLDFLEKHKLDVIVSHGSGGFPLQLFDELDIPIITYIEFPSFTLHGYDAKYPQPEYAKYVDKLFEMTSFHQVIKSQLVIVPSNYAKTMYPSYLQHKIFAQMEGFDIKRSKPTYEKDAGYFYIGFAARDLSSAKGFEQFVIIAKEVLKYRQNVKFIFCGAPKALYSYEGEFLQKFYGDGHNKTFMDYLFEREGIDLSDNPNFKHVDFAGYNEFAGYVESMDLFLYPLQFGSANWGLFELLFRGKLVIGSNRCFIPEVIKHRVNGLLCNYDDIKGWVDTILDVIENYDNYKPIMECALYDAQKRFSIENVVNQYIEIFESAIHLKKIGAV